MVIKPEQLTALNLVLESDPVIRTALQEKVQTTIQALVELGKAIEPEPIMNGHTPDPVQSTGRTADELEPLILDWFKHHPGRHRLTDCRKELGVDQTSKPFKRATARLIDAKKVKHNGKRGMGAEYWI